MILSLTIQNFVLIDHLTIDFNPTFSVITGETGAGKSIIMDAISLLCGERVNSSYIKTNTDKAYLEGVFSVSEVTKEKLESNGLDSDCLIVSREFDRDGRNICRINNRSVTLSILKDIVSSIVDIHQQHDNQYLLDNKFHQSLLDKFANNDELLQQVKLDYKQYQKLNDELTELANVTYSQQQFDLLSFQVNEIEEMHLDPVKDDELENQLKVLAEGEKIREKTSLAISLLDDDNGVINKLYEVNKALKNTKAAEMETLSDKANNIYFLASELKENISDYLATINLDEDQINQMNERLFNIARLKRKYGPSIEIILDKKSKMEQELELMENRNEVLAKKEQEVNLALEKYNQSAAILTENRIKYAQQLDNLVNEQLKDLQLSKAIFKVEVSIGSISAHGSDSVQFMISTNPGEPLKALNKIASGGELSRIMLGLKTIFTQLKGVELVIFDEIDSGVSGSVALSIGFKMKEIAQNAQVFAITHLPAVAACGNYQYEVIKNQTKENTSVSITQLDYNQRIEALALMSSGEITDASCLAASELLERVKTHEKVAYHIG